MSKKVSTTNSNLVSVGTSNNNTIQETTQTSKPDLLIHTNERAIQEEEDENYKSELTITSNLSNSNLKSSAVPSSVLTDRPSAVNQTQDYRSVVMGNLDRLGYDHMFKSQSWQ